MSNNDIKVCVLVGEGKSEKAFFSSLLVNQLHFVGVTASNCIVFSSELDPGLFWIIPISSFGSSHKGGYRILQKTSTYKDCKGVIDNTGMFLEDILKYIIESLQIVITNLLKY